MSLISICRKMFFRLFVYAIALFLATMSFFMLFLNFLRRPILFCQPLRRRLTPPKCMLDESLGQHEYVQANGIKFHYVTSGDKSKPLMLFLHGFPEFWYSWRHQIREFNKDYHVVAVDMRGYGETDIPPKTSDYNIKTLCQDIVQLIPALGHSSTVLVAHDWGGAVAWAVAQTHPEVVEKLVIMNSPHPRAVSAVADFSQKLKSLYMFLFQLPWWPEFLLARFDLAFLNDALCGKKAGVRNKDAISSDDLEAYKYTFSQPNALTGPINYYRCIYDNASLIKKTSNIEVSTLIIWGDDDQFLRSKMAEAHKSFVSDLTVRHLTNCSHWTQQDQPEQVNQLMGEFLQ